MKQKTAMQKVIEELDLILQSEKYEIGSISAIKRAKELTESYLPEERQQIIAFHVACVDHGAIEEGETVTQQDKEWIKNHAEKYYNETYGSHDKAWLVDVSIRVDVRDTDYFNT